MMRAGWQRVWPPAHRKTNLAGSYQRPPVRIVVNERPAGSSAHVVAHVPPAGVVRPALLAGVPVALGAAQCALTITVRNMSDRVIFICHSALRGLEPRRRPSALVLLVALGQASFELCTPCSLSLDGVSSAMCERCIRSQGEAVSVRGCFLSGVSCLAACGRSCKDCACGGVECEPDG